MKKQAFIVGLLHCYSFWSYAAVTGYAQFAKDTKKVTIVAFDDADAAAQESSEGSYQGIVSKLDTWKKLGSARLHLVLAGVLLPAATPLMVERNNLSSNLAAEFFQQDYSYSSAQKTYRQGTLSLAAFKEPLEDIIAAEHEAQNFLVVVPQCHMQSAVRACVAAAYQQKMSTVGAKSLPNPLVFFENHPPVAEHMVEKSPLLSPRLLPLWMRAVSPQPGALQPANVVAADVAERAALRAPYQEFLFNHLDSTTGKQHSPIQNKLLELIDGELRLVQVAIYSLSSQVITASLKKALRRGVAVEIVGDGKQMQESYSLQHYKGLLSEGAHVFKYDNRTYTSWQKLYRNNMHHKFVVFHNHEQAADGIVWHGTFNFSTNATESEEDATVEYNNLVAQESFVDRFEELKARSTRLALDDLIVQTTSSAAKRPNMGTLAATPPAKKSSQTNLLDVPGINAASDADDA